MPGATFICLDRHMPNGVYKKSGICVRDYCGAEPPRDIEPAGLVATVGGRDRAATSYAAADRFQAPASAARRGFRGIHGGRTAASLPAEAGTTAGSGCLAGSVPPVLVCSHRCSRTSPGPHRSTKITEEEGKEKINDRSRPVRTGSRRRGAGTKGRREVDPYSGERNAPLTGKSLAGADRPGAPARVGALRGRGQSGDGWTREAQLGGNAAGYRNKSDASRRSQGARV